MKYSFRRYLLVSFTLFVALPVLAESSANKPEQNQGAEKAQTEDEKMKELVEYEHMKARQRREQQMEKPADKVE
jgi:hypothetical protein